MTALHDDTVIQVSSLFRKVLRWQTIAVLLLSIATSSCATSNALRTGQIAERERNYDAAIIAYTRAIQENPRDRDAQLSLERARLRAAQLHYNEGRRFSQNGEWDSALTEYQIAYELNPTMGDIEREISETRDAIRVELSKPENGLTEPAMPPLKTFHYHRVSGSPIPLYSVTPVRERFFRALVSSAV